jgi:sugar phosphate isomerase/epimerase
MPQLGLVSISFRGLSPEKIIEEAKKAGLSCIEWGSDVHAPCSDTESLKKIADLQKQAGLFCCSYGTYFRLGKTDIGELQQYIDAAKILGTDILRLWCGTKSSRDYTEEEENALFSVCREAALIAEKNGVTLCMECHNGTYTDTKESAIRLMKEVNSPAFRMYWQPNQFVSIEENKLYARLLSPFTRHIHVFNWTATDRYPLMEAVLLWKEYLSYFDDNTLLLEFMPDDDIGSLKTEAEALRRLTE